MQLVLARLRAPASIPAPSVNPEAVVDILWSVTVPDDRLEHVRARHGPGPGVLDLVIFLRIGATPVEEAAEALCRRAIATAPILSDWSVAAVGVLGVQRGTPL